MEFNVDPPKNILDIKKKTTILKMFNLMDPNGNGFVTQKEFEQYLRSQGSHLSKERTELLFKNILERTTIDTDRNENGITFRDLVKYFENEEIQLFLFTKLNPY